MAAALAAAILSLVTEASSEDFMGIQIIHLKRQTLPGAQVSPCVRIFIESLFSEFADMSPGEVFAVLDSRPRHKTRGDTLAAQRDDEKRKDQEVIKQWLVAK